MKKASLTQAAVISCNVSYKKCIDTSTLVKILLGKGSLEAWYSHMDTFFNEIPLKFIIGVMDENKLSLAQIEKIFFSLPPVYQGQRFKDFIKHAEIS